MRTTLAAAVVIGVSSIASAGMTFREWIDTHSMAVNSAANEWYATTGLNGPLMASSGTASWYSPGLPSSTPLFGPLTEVGGSGGAAGPATFPGVFVHPGSAVPAVLVYAPQSKVVIEAITVHAELIINGLSGNGVKVSVNALIDGTASAVGGTGLISGTGDHYFTYAFANPVAMEPGDKVRILFSDNASFLYDHVNFDVWASEVPAPGAMALLAGAGLVAGRRRRGA